METARVVFDLNVILDVLQRREPHFDDSARALALAETGRVQGFVAAHSLTTLYYLASKGRSPAAARTLLLDLLQIASVAAVGPTEIERALGLPYSDFEDAVQMAAAMGVGAEYFVTRDMKGFAAGPLPAVRPIELLALLHDPFESDLTGE